MTTNNHQLLLLLQTLTTKGILFQDAQDIVHFLLLLHNDDDDNNDYHSTIPHLQQQYSTMSDFQQLLSPLKKGKIIIRAAHEALMMISPSSSNTESKTTSSQAKKSFLPPFSSITTPSIIVELSTNNYASYAVVIAITPDGHKIWLALDDGRFHIYNMNGILLQEINDDETRGSGCAVCCSPRNDYVFGGGEDSQIFVWTIELSSYKLQRTLENRTRGNNVDEGSILALCVDEEGKYVARCCVSSCVAVYEIGNEWAMLFKSTNIFLSNFSNTIAFFRNRDTDEMFLAGASLDNIGIINVKTKTQMERFWQSTTTITTSETTTDDAIIHDAPISCMMTSPKYGAIVTASDSAVILWNSHGTILGKITDKYVGGGVAVSDHFMVVTNRSAQIFFFQLPKLTHIGSVMNAHSRFITAQAIYEPLGVVITASSDFTLKWWQDDLHGGRNDIITAPPLPPPSIINDVYSTSQFFFTGGTTLSMTTNLHAMVKALDITPQGKIWLALDDGSFQIFDIITGSCIQEFFTTTSTIFHNEHGNLEYCTISCSLKNDYVAGGGSDNQIFLWKQQQQIFILQRTITGVEDEGSIITVRIDDESKYVASCHISCRVVLHDINQGVKLFTTSTLFVTKRNCNNAITFFTNRDTENVYIAGISVDQIAVVHINNDDTCTESLDFFINTNNDNQHQQTAALIDVQPCRHYGVIVTLSSQTIILWNTQGKILGQISADITRGEIFTGMSISDHFLVISHQDTSLIFYQLPSLTFLRRVENGTSISAQGLYEVSGILIVAGMDKTLKWWKQQQPTNSNTGDENLQQFSSTTNSSSGFITAKKSSTRPFALLNTVTTSEEEHGGERQPQPSITVQLENTCYMLDITPNGSAIWTTQNDGSFHVYDINGELLQQFKANGTGCAIACSPVNDFVVGGGRNGEMYIWKLDDTLHVKEQYILDQTLTNNDDTSAISAICVDEHGRYVAYCTVSCRMCVFYYEIENNQWTKIFTSETMLFESKYSNTMAFFTNHNTNEIHVASSILDEIGIVHIITNQDTQTKSCQLSEKLWNGHDGDEITHMTRCPNNKYASIASASKKKVVIWTSEGTILYQITNENHVGWCVAVSENYVIVGTDQGSIHIFELLQEDGLHHISSIENAHKNYVFAQVVYEPLHLFVSTGNDDVLCWWKG
jgi:hypothetical protein